MTEQQAIKIINEEKSWESDDRKIDAFIMAVDALEEIQQYHEIGLTPQMVKDLIKSEKQAHKDAVHNAKLLDEYLTIGTADEFQAAVEKKRAKRPIYKHYEDKGEPPYIKIACPNGCRIQLYPVTDRHLAHEHVFCPKCGQKLDWGDEE